jgi:hypothetical protein
MSSHSQFSGVALQCRLSRGLKQLTYVLLSLPTTYVDSIVVFVFICLFETGYLNYTETSKPGGQV